MSHPPDFQSLIDYLTKAPAIVGPIGSGVNKKNLWWVKFAIDIDHPLAWRVVQELGHVLNYVSINERLPYGFHAGFATGLPEWWAKRIPVLGDRVQGRRL